MNLKSVCLGAASMAALSICLPNAGYAQSQLPAVTVDAPSQQAARTAKPARRASRSSRATRRAAAPAQRQVVVPQDNAGAGVERAKGHVDGYLATRSASATKTDTSILETPQSISVVTQDQIAAQGVQSVNDALRYTPGVSLESFGANTFFDLFNLRGVDAPRYLDGLRLPND
jgi:iron complex outermembrane receptor protein